MLVAPDPGQSPLEELPDLALALPGRCHSDGGVDIGDVISDELTQDSCCQCLTSQSFIEQNKTVLEGRPKVTFLLDRPKIGGSPLAKESWVNLPDICRITYLVLPFLLVFYCVMSV